MLSGPQKQRVLLLAHLSMIYCRLLIHFLSARTLLNVCYSITPSRTTAQHIYDRQEATIKGGNELSMSSSSSASASLTSVPTSFLQTLQQEFIEGNFCDCIIRVTIPPSDAADEEDGDDEEEEQGPVAKKARKAKPEPIDIPCHRVVLSSRSPYFRSAWACQYEEAKKKIVAIVLEDNQMVQDLRLLLKLNYTDSYVKDDEGVLLEKDTRLRLALLGYAFEFRDCVEEYIASLGEGLTMEDAMTLSDNIPEELHANNSVKNVLNAKIIEALTKGITELQEESAEREEAKKEKTNRMQEAGDALTKVLGSVCGFFEEGKVMSSGTLSTTSFYGRVPLKSHVKELPFPAMWVLSASKKLRLQAEDEAYTLLCSWLCQSPLISEQNDRKMTRLFKRFIKHLRVKCFSTDFLGCVVSCCPIAEEAGLVTFLLCRGYTFRHVNKQLAAECGVDTYTGEDSRAIRGEAVSGVFDTEISLKDLLTVSKGCNLYKPLGVVGRYPVIIIISHEIEETLGVYVRFDMPGGYDRKEEADGLAMGFAGWRVGVAFSLQLGSVRIYGERLMGRLGYGNDLVFFENEGKKWGGIVCKNSPLFPNGVLKVYVNVKKIEGPVGRGGVTSHN